MFEDEDPEELDVNDDLIDLGFDSITLLDLSHMVNRRFGVDISTLTFFDFPSVAQLAGHLVDVYGDAVQTALSSGPPGA